MVKIQQPLPEHIATIEKIIADLPPERRTWMQTMRATIQTAVPEAVEFFGYGLPGYKYRGKPLAYYSAWKNHYGYYAASGAIIAANQEALKGQTTSKGTIQFPLDKPVPVALIKKMVKARRAEIDAAEDAKAAKKKSAKKKST